MALPVADLALFFEAPMGSEVSLALLQQLAPTERRLLLAARGLSDEAPLNAPGDLGLGVASSLDAVFAAALEDPELDGPWLVRASASLFGVLISASTGGRWAPPEGLPLFASLQVGRASALVSPLRLALDAFDNRRPRFHESLAGIQGFLQGRRPLPSHIFRVDMEGVAEEILEPWHWAWSLVAAFGRFDGQWDLAFTLGSVARLERMLYSTRGARRTRVKLAFQSVDRDEARREDWLVSAASAYLGESLRASFGGRWQRTSSRPGRLVFSRGRQIEPRAWVLRALPEPEGRLTGLVSQLRAASEGQAPWPG